MSVAQLAERSLTTPELRVSNPDIGIELVRTYIYQLLSRKGENKEKEAGNGPLKKNYLPPVGYLIFQNALAY